MDSDNPDITILSPPGGYPVYIDGKLIGYSAGPILGYSAGPFEVVSESLENDLSDCPFYQRAVLNNPLYGPNEGVCDRGCFDEPACVTNEPRDGWPSQIHVLEPDVLAWEVS